MTKSFGAARALDGVELEIRRGEIFGFIGPDGAGKTTMMRMAMGIINPDEGECLLLGSADRRAARVRAVVPVLVYPLVENLVEGAVKDRVRLVELVEEYHVRLALHEVLREAVARVPSAEEVRRKLVAVEHRKLLAQQGLSHNVAEILRRLRLAYARRTVEEKHGWFLRRARGERI